MFQLQAIYLLLHLWVIIYVRAHSNLGYPLSYNPLPCKATNPWCKPTTCPPVWSTVRSSPRRPAAVWRRGSRVLIVYHKNNHNGGFWRRSLVPVRYMFNQYWHRRGAFEWGCWSQGSFKCGNGPLCGGDKWKRAYRTWMTVPRVFPDGDYVFVQSWYGGLFWRANRPQFPDYTSCAFVRIRGGPVSQTHRPRFIRGFQNKHKVPPGVCATGKLFLGQCGGAECRKNKVMYSKPGEFRNGKSPPVVRLAWYKPIGRSFSRRSTRRNFERLFMRKAHRWHRMRIYG